ncbi:MAG TPA: cell envelope integrity protein CreD [Alphaproteobacteria bacterium]|nr:cell envelope integrity protein CreD [Alphaproteobacteria bacterium]
MTDISQTSETPPAVSDFPMRKVVIVALLLIGTLIAGWRISGVVEERQDRQAETLDGFRTSWGPEQTLRGPILVVPYQPYPGTEARYYFEITPDLLTARTVLSPMERKRGLFHATVYNATVALEGRFTIPKSDFLGKDVNLLWQEAFVVVSTETLSGMTSADHFSWGGTTVRWQNCRELMSNTDCVVPAALVARVSLSAPPTVGTQLPFGATLTLRGTSAFKQALQGVAVDSTVEGTWGSPSFGGSVLPVDSNVAGDSFSAHWKIADFSSPKAWKAYHVIEKASDSQAITSVALLEATPTYRMINRASKYNILFVVLAFTTYFLFELLTKVRIHPLQYGLLGGSLTLFALLLVSFAEMIGYDAGYAVSAGLVLLQASVYTAMVTRRLVHSLMFGAMLASLFGFLYVLLSLETYSLLVGSLGLFLVLSLVMALTQRVKWFAVARTAEA